MKTKILLAIFILFSLSTNQLYGQVEFPTLNAHWCYDGYTELSFDPWNYCISPSELVELNGRTYSKISYFSHPDDPSEQDILYRGEGRKFYVIPQDSTEEILIYDFNLEVGDTFVATWGWQIWNSFESLEVYAVDTILTVDGIARKTITLGNVSSYGTWVEGIGSQDWIFVYPGYSGWLDAGYNVTCHFQEEEPIHSPWGNAESCDLDALTGISETELNSTFDLYPNPVREILTVKFKDLKIHKIKIIDFSGNMVFENKVDLQQYSLRTSNILASGVYLIQVHKENGSIVTKKFVKM